jgi:hypothetical protein
LSPKVDLFPFRLSPNAPPIIAGDL